METVEAICSDEHSRVTPIGSLMNKCSSIDVFSFVSHWLDNRQHRYVIIVEIKWSTSAARYAITAYLYRA